jgi:hypothetical protein
MSRRDDVSVATNTRNGQRQLVLFANSRTRTNTATGARRAFKRCSTAPLVPAGAAGSLSSARAASKGATSTERGSRLLLVDDSGTLALTECGRVR